MVNNFAEGGIFERFFGWLNQGICAVTQLPDAFRDQIDQNVWVRDYFLSFCEQGCVDVHKAKYPRGIEVPLG